MLLVAHLLCVYYFVISEKYIRLSVFAIFLIPLYTHVGSDVVAN